MRNNSAIILQFIPYFIQMINFQMGSSVGRLLQNWFAQGLDINRFHLVGHSLGGQLAGMVGRYIITDSKNEMKLKRSDFWTIFWICKKQSEWLFFTFCRISRISGLDPANPPFFPALIMLALGKNDADFVDIIHTDAGLYGALIATGTVDFWPNGGTTLQPGCPTRSFKPLTDNGVFKIPMNRKRFRENLILYNLSMS